MKIKPKQNKKEKDIQDDLYFSGDDENKQRANKLQNSQNRVKTETNKKDSKRPPPINNQMQIKLQKSDIRFIENIIQQKHGKIMSRQQMMSLKKKMVKDTFTQSNPYTQMNYNTGERNEWIDNKKKTLSLDQVKKLKIHFLNIMKMVDRGQQSKYTLRDLSRQFNLDQSAFLQLKRQFSIDPDVSIYICKSSISTLQNVENLRIAHRKRKKQILQKFIQKNPLLTLKEMNNKIPLEVKNKLSGFSEKQMEKILQQQSYSCKAVIKYPESRNFKQNLERKKSFCQNINYILTQTKYKVYFLGIMNFNSYMFRSHGWTKDEYLIEPMYDQSFTLMGLTQRTGQGTWKFQKEIYKEQVFLDTVKILFDILLSQEFQPKYIVLDFSLFKYQDVLRKSRKKYDLEIIWIPPFSGHLNPLEFWFQQIKNSLTKSKKMLKLSQQCNITSQKNLTLVQGIYNDLCEIFKTQYNSNFQFTKYFEMTAKYHEKALKLQKI